MMIARAPLLWLCALLVPAALLVSAALDTTENKVPETEGPVRAANASNNVYCRQPVKVGSCRAAFRRFYYLPTNQSCFSFIYGGCNANMNNWESLEECETACKGVEGPVLPDESTPAPPPVKAARMAPAFRADSQEDDAVKETQPATESVPTDKAAADFAERCYAASETGPCRAAFQRWFFNRRTGSCQSFIYGGCGAKKNNYETEGDCVASCMATVLSSSRKQSTEVSADHQDMCMVPPDSGPCRASFPMFYFDHQTSSCQSFTYGGCHGNKNRYGSEDECMKQCNVEGCAFGRFHIRDRWTAAVFLFLSLSSVSALLILVIMMMRRRRARRGSSVSDKQELLPEDDHSSVDSLSLPDSPPPVKA